MEKINNNLYQVFLMNCQCGLPISFATHNWFVVNMKGKLSRWEVLIQKDAGGTSWGHLHENFRAPFEPLGTFTMDGPSWWDAEMISYIEGGEGSLAHKMAEFILNSPTTYPFNDEYFLISPNSNTYVQWVLDRFPDFPGEMPWHSFGKRYKIEEKVK